MRDRLYRFLLSEPSTKMQRVLVALVLLELVVGLVTGLVMLVSGG